MTSLEGFASMLTPDQFKCMTCILVLLLGLIGGLLPLKLMPKTPNHGRCDNTRSMLLITTTTKSVQSSFISMFTAGIFLSSALLHFLPQATQNKQLDTYMEQKWFFSSQQQQQQQQQGDDDSSSSSSSNYPWATLLFAISFLFLLSFEAIADEIHRLRVCLPSSMSDEDECKCEELLLPHDTLSENVKVLYNSIQHTGGQHPYHKGGDMEEGLESLLSYDTPDTTECCPDHTTECCPDHTTECHSEPIQHNENTNENKVQTLEAPKVVSFVAFMSLSFHSIMEGIGLGAQPTCDWDILFAIAAHKSLVAFSLGVEILNQSTNERLYIVFIVLFSIMTPLGVLLGWSLTTIFAETDNNAMTGICMSLSGGTFLFISVMEIIPHELKSRGHVGWKLIALFLGFSTIAILTSFV